MSKPCCCPSPEQATPVNGLSKLCPEQISVLDDPLGGEIDRLEGIVTAITSRRAAIGVSVHPRGLLYLSFLAATRLIDR